MTQINIKSFAEQIGVTADKLLVQLEAAGLGGKKESDSISDEERIELLNHLSGGSDKGTISRKSKITLRQRTTSQVKRTTRTGSTHTVQVEVRKRRTFVKRSTLEDAADIEESSAEVPASIGEVNEQELPKVDVSEAVPEKVEAETLAVESVESPESPEPEAEKIAEPVVESPTADSDAAAAEASANIEAVTETEQPVEVPTEPVKAPEPAADEAAAKAAKSGRKPKKAGKAGKGESVAKRGDRKAPKSRSELHVANNKKGRRRTRPQRISANVTTSISGQHGFEKPSAPVIHDVIIPETITVGELAQAMSVKAAEVIKVLMQLGSMVTINQVLDRDTATVVVEEMGHKVNLSGPQDPEALLVEDETADVTPEPRPPVVTVMGHVDHGKTSLLDYIRSSKVASGEAGGITQHVGAYRVNTAQGVITFLDTPGHEAFTAMRARGADATDLVILVIAADDGVKPQTIEAIHHAREAEVPIVVAINKIDKPEADVDRVKQELSSHEVISEEWGGDVLMAEISAKTGQGINELLESVLLQTEVLDLKAVAEGPASGVVVEARLDKGRGVVATVLVQKGKLAKGDIILAGRESGRVRALNDEKGKTVREAGPSTPVEIQGLTGVPVAGDDVSVVSDDRKAREIALFRQGKFKEVKLARQQAAKLENMFQQMSEGEMKSLNLLVKADVQGSVEALTDALEKLSMDEIQVKVVHGMVGGINESDVNLAVASQAIIIGFNVRAESSARKLIESEGVDVHYYNVIYDVVDEVKAAMSGLLAPELKENVIGRVDVREVFRAPRIGAIAGCYVLEGQVRRNREVRVLRDNIVIFDGKIDSLRRFKDDVIEVKAGMECGIGVKNYNDIKVGDQLEVYESIEVRKVV